MTNDLTITNVRSVAGEKIGLNVSNGRFAASANPSAEVIDGGGRIALPGFVDAHMHLDKTLWGLPWRPHTAGVTLNEKIENERRVRHELGADTASQAIGLIRQASKNGTTHIRTHVDVDPEIGLSGMHALFAARDACKAFMDVQIVAFPQSGILRQPGTADLLAEAIRQGADLIGGIDPHGVDGDAKEHIRTVFEIADKEGVGMDIHHHEEDDPGADTLDLILDAVATWSMQGKVTLSHAFCIGMVDETRREKLLQRIKSLDVSIMTHAPGYKPFPPLKDLARHEIATCSGSDGVRDVWSPYGTADMLERAMLLGYRSNFRRDDEIALAFDICSRGGADVMGLENYGINVGDEADCVLVAAETLAEAVVSRPIDRIVMKRGKIVAE